jgi:hypothetical protein
MLRVILRDHGISLAQNFPSLLNKVTGKLFNFLSNAVIQVRIFLSISHPTP